MLSDGSLITQASRILEAYWDEPRFHSSPGLGVRGILAHCFKTPMYAYAAYVMGDVELNCYYNGSAFDADESYAQAGLAWEALPHHLQTAWTIRHKDLLGGDLRALQYFSSNPDQDTMWNYYRQRCLASRKSYEPHPHHTLDAAFVQTAPVQVRIPDNRSAEAEHVTVKVEMMPAVANSAIRAQRQPVSGNVQRRPSASVPIKQEYSSDSGAGAQSSTLARPASPGALAPLIALRAWRTPQDPEKGLVLEGARLDLKELNDACQPALSQYGYRGAQKLGVHYFVHLNSRGSAESAIMVIAGQIRIGNKICKARLWVAKKYLHFPRQSYVAHNVVAQR